MVTYCIYSESAQSICVYDVNILLKIDIEVFKNLTCHSIGNSSNYNDVIFKGNILLINFNQQYVTITSIFRCNVTSKVIKLGYVLSFKRRNLLFYSYNYDGVILTIYMHINHTIKISMSQGFRIYITLY